MKSRSRRLHSGLRMNSTSLHLNSPNQTHHTAKQTQREHAGKLIQFSCAGWMCWLSCCCCPLVGVVSVCLCSFGVTQERCVMRGNGMKIIQDVKERGEWFRSGLVVEARALSCVQNRLAHVSLSTIIYFHSPLSSLICSLIQQFALLACSGQLWSIQHSFSSFFLPAHYWSISMIVSIRKYHIIGEVEIWRIL